MTLKIYLAGGFYQENDWRYELVKGLRDATIEPWNGSNKWEVIPQSILDCVDFVGPYPEDDGIVRHKLSIQDADIVFLWVGNDNTSDISKYSFELGYAAALDKLVGIGSEFSDNEHFWDIAHAVFSSSPWWPVPCVSTNPLDSFRLFLTEALDGLSVEQVMRFRKSSKAARLICGERYQKAGYVYVIRADTGHYKIGRTCNLPNRMKLFTVKLPFEFEIITHFPCEDMHQAESTLHEVFSEGRVNGEWFNLSSEDIYLLKTVTRSRSGLFFNREDKPIGDLLIEPDEPWYTEAERQLIMH